jgi:membrane-associated HD superfamily phosphohydrolase
MAGNGWHFTITSNHMSHLEHSLITPTSYTAFVAHCVINQRRYDMSTLNEVHNNIDMPWDVEQATATYYMEKDMSAMAARIDQLLAENDRLQRALTKEST